MNSKHHLLGYAMVAGAILTTGVISWVRAGDVDPPAGAVQGTMHTLEEIYQRVLQGTQAGSAGRWKSVYVPGESGAITIVATGPGVLHGVILDGACSNCGRIMLYDANSTSIGGLPRMTELTHTSSGSSMYFPLDVEFSSGLVLQQSASHHPTTLIYRLD